MTERIIDVWMQHPTERAVRRYPPELCAVHAGARPDEGDVRHQLSDDHRSQGARDDLKLDAEARALFLGGNAARVFGL